MTFPKHPKIPERGQAIMLVAIALVGLIAIIGLMIDGGMYLIEYSRLKRSVDAAAISAALQFREGYTIVELEDIAVEFIQLNQVDAYDLLIETCDTNGDLCTNPARKLVRVTATRKIDFGFLPVIGIRDATITADAVGEAASVDAILVIDASASMAYEGGGDPNRGDDPADDPSVCNPAKSCQPFEQIKTVAANFVDHLYFPFDRVGVVTFDRDPHKTQPLTASKTAALSRISNLNVYQPPACNTAHGPCLNYDVSGNYLGLECPLYRSTGDPSSCTSSNIGGGFAVAGNMFADPPMRDESLWVVILLAGGPANATTRDMPHFPYGYCPLSTWVTPFCRGADVSAATRHDSGDIDYDADDFARDMADFVADPVNGQGAVIFTIGLGELVQNTPVGDPEAGEKLLKYAAEEAGGTHANHGVYYYAPTPAQLDEIFRSIAENIATRLSQ